MYEIAITCLEKEIKPDDFLKLIFETGRIEQERSNKVKVDEGFYFPDCHFGIKYKETKGNKLFFVITEKANEKDVALAYGQFITFLLSSSVPINEKMEIDRTVESKDVTELTNFIEAIWIRRERQPNKK